LAASSFPSHASSQPTLRRVFTANIRNPNTRQAHAQAVSQFLFWCEFRQLGLSGLTPFLVPICGSTAKGGKLRYTLGRINEYLEASDHREDLDGPLFRPVKNPNGGKLDKPLCHSAIYHRIVKHYAALAGVDMPGFCNHSLRDTAATNALDHHSDIATTRLYDRRKTKPEDSPTFKVAYYVSVFMKRPTKGLCSRRALCMCRLNRPGRHRRSRILDPYGGR
jgi:integrase